MLKNWKTTITGIILAIVLGVQPLAETGKFDLRKDWFRYSLAILVAVLGVISKDPTFNKDQK